MAATDPIIISDLRGGWNGVDSPLEMPENQCPYSVNIDWSKGQLATRRGGSASVSTTGGTAVTTGIYSIFRHVPAGDETLAELWSIDAVGVVKRLVGGTAWADVTLADAISDNFQHVQFCSLNGKLYIAYNSSVDRLHVWDPTLSSPKVRRVGLAASGAPTRANQGAGASYTDVVPRYYRIRTLQVSSGVLVRRSEPSTAAAIFTPSGTADSVRVTQPTMPSEDETHWEVEASLDGSVYYVLYGFEDGTHIAAATTTKDDTILTTAYSDYPTSEESGSFTLWKSVKYLATDGNKLIGAGAWETGNPTSRIYFSPVLGSSDHGDDERVVNTVLIKGWVDLNEKDGGSITALGEPLLGVVPVFKYRQTHKLTPTGDVTAPYAPRKVSNVIGCIHQKTTVMGEDALGNPSLYFLSHKGPYRYTIGGLMACGRDVEDLWFALRGLPGVNLAATLIVGSGVWHSDKNQVWFHVAAVGENVPNIRLKLSVKQQRTSDEYGMRGGWTLDLGNGCGAVCAAPFANTLGAAMGLTLKPYLGVLTVNNSTGLIKGDTTDMDDFGVKFKAYFITRGYIPSGNVLKTAAISDPLIVGEVFTATVQMTIVQDFFKATSSASVSMAAATSELRVVRKFEGLQMADGVVYQFQVGDADALQAQNWSLDKIIIPLELEGRT